MFRLHNFFPFPPSVPGFRISIVFGSCFITLQTYFRHTNTPDLKPRFVSSLNPPVWFCFWIPHLGTWSLLQTSHKLTGVGPNSALNPRANIHWFLPYFKSIPLKKNTFCSVLLKVLTVVRKENSIQSALSITGILGAQINEKSGSDKGISWGMLG